MEAGWLVTVLVVPVFFNVYSNRIFEADKTILLRSLALLMLAAWLIKLLDQGRLSHKSLQIERSKIRSMLSVPLIAPVLALTGVYLISTLLSISPGTSLFGSYTRLQGTYTTFSYLVIFFVMAANLRQPEQVERVITVIVLASLPVSLYGILQRLQLDPIPWGGDQTRRAVANLGNPIFLGAYLAMVFPLTVGRMLQSISGFSHHNLRTLFTPNMILGGVYATIAGLQLIAQYLSASRGPALALLAAMFVMLLMLALIQHKRSLSLVILTSSLVLAAFLLSFNLAGGLFASLRESPIVGRYGQILDPQSTNAQVRAFIWQGSARLVAPHTPLQFPDGSLDTFNAVRPLTGYGPESMHLVFNPFFPPQLGQIEGFSKLVDRAHNITWDALITTGILGLLAYLSLFSALFYFGLKWTGFIQSRKQSLLFLSLLLGGSILVGVSLVLWRGIGYIGIALPLGMLAGLIAYLGMATLRSWYPPEASPTGYPHTLILTMLFAGILAHFIEINFGIATVTTRTLFWVYAAVSLVLAEKLPKSIQEPFTKRTAAAVGERHPTSVALKSRPKTHKKRKPKPQPLPDRFPDRGYVQQVGFRAGMLSLLLVCLSFLYLSNAHNLASPWGVVWSSLSKLPAGNSTHGYGILGLVLISLVIATFVLLVGRAPNERVFHHKPVLAGTVGISAVVGSIFALWQSGKLVTLSRIPSSSASTILLQADLTGSLFTQFVLVVLALTLLIGFSLVDGWPTKWSHLNWRGVVTTLGLLSGTLILIIFANLGLIQADIVYKLAENQSRLMQYELANNLYEKALALSSRADQYLFSQGNNYFQQARITPDETAQSMLVQAAESKLVHAQEINPLHIDYSANLARLHGWLATQSEDAGQRYQRGTTASEYFSRALVLSPNNPILWAEWAGLYLEVLNLPDQALPRLERALQLDPHSSLIHNRFGAYYYHLALASAEAAERIELLEKASHAYQTAISLSGEDENQERVNQLVSLGRVYFEMGELQKALLAFEEAIQAAPGSADAWRLHEISAHLSSQMGDSANALHHAILASRLAPSDQLPRLQALIDQLQSTP
jgi:tetratricopeptide (TPR) repeat protein